MVRMINNKLLLISVKWLWWSA